MASTHQSRQLLAFIHIFKTGGTTFTGILRRNYGTRHFDTRLLKRDDVMTAAQLRRALWVYPRVLTLAGHGIRPFSDLDRHFKNLHYCSFLREPVARVVSGFQFRARHCILYEGWKPETRDEIAAFFDRSVVELGSDTVGAFSQSGDLDEALLMLEERIGFVGIVEDYDRSLAVLREWAKPLGFDLDIRYRRSNVSAAKDDAKARPFAGSIARIAEYAAEVKRDSGRLDQLQTATARERHVYDAAVQKFGGLRERLLPGVTTLPAIEADSVAEDDWFGHRYRNIVGRPIIPMITRRL